MRKIEEKMLYAGEYRSLVLKTFEMPDGREHNYEITDPNGVVAAMVCAIDVEGRFIMTREFRVGPEKYVFDVPGGGVDGGEDMFGAARRELAEETGYEAGKLEHLGMLNLDAYSEVSWQCFLATGCEKKFAQKLDETEFIEVVLKNRDEIMEEIEKGNVMLGCAGVILLALRKMGCKVE